MKRLIGLLASVMLVGSLLGSVAAAPAAAVTFQWSVLENDSFIGDEWLPGGTFVANFACCSNNLVNGCNRPVGTNPNWNDCISRLGLKGLTSTDCMVWYMNSSYGGNALIQPGPFGSSGWAYLGSLGAWNDTISSAKRWPKTDPHCGGALAAQPGLHTATDGTTITVLPAGK